VLRTLRLYSYEEPSWALSRASLIMTMTVSSCVPSMSKPTGAPDNSSGSSPWVPRVSALIPM
jgi:hypothetical protein